MDKITDLLPVLPIALGMMGHFAPFLDTRKYFRERVSWIEGKLKENLNVYLANIFENVKAACEAEGLDDPLRGDETSPDLIKRYTEESWRAFDALTKVARLHLWFKVGHFVLLLTTLAGVLLLLLALANSFSVSTLSKLTYWVLGIQMFSIVLVYIISNKLDNYE